MSNKNPKEIGFYWNHPELYQRMTRDDLMNEPTLILCEEILSGIREEMEKISALYAKNPKSESIRNAKTEMIHTLESNFINALSFGRSYVLVEEFNKMCEPKKKKTIRRGA